MRKFLDGFRSSVSQQARPDQEIVETLRPDNFQVAKMNEDIIRAKSVAAPVKIVDDQLSSPNKTGLNGFEESAVAKPDSISKSYLERIQFQSLDKNEPVRLRVNGRDVGWELRRALFATERLGDQLVVAGIPKEQAAKMGSQVQAILQDAVEHVEDVKIDSKVAARDVKILDYYVKAYSDLFASQQQQIAKEVFTKDVSERIANCSANEELKYQVSQVEQMIMSTNLTEILRNTLTLDKFEYQDETLIDKAIKDRISQVLFEQKTAATLLLNLALEKHCRNDHHQHSDLDLRLFFEPEDLSPSFPGECPECPCGTVPPDLQPAESLGNTSNIYEPDEKREIVTQTTTIGCECECPCGTVPPEECTTTQCTTESTTTQCTTESTTTQCTMESTTTQKQDILNDNCQCQCPCGTVPPCDPPTDPPVETTTEPSTTNYQETVNDNCQCPCGTLPPCLQIGTTYCPNCADKSKFASTICPNCTLEFESLTTLCPNCTIESESSTTLCPNCTLESESSTTLCPNCTLESESSTTLCPNCTLEFESSTTLCPNCTTETSGGLPTTESTVPKVPQAHLSKLFSTINGSPSSTTEASGGFSTTHSTVPKVPQSPLDKSFPTINGSSSTIGESGSLSTTHSTVPKVPQAPLEKSFPTINGSPSSTTDQPNSKFDQPHTFEFNRITLVTESPENGNVISPQTESSVGPTLPFTSTTADSQSNTITVPHKQFQREFIPFNKCTKFSNGSCVEDIFVMGVSVTVSETTTTTAKDSNHLRELTPFGKTGNGTSSLVEKIPLTSSTVESTTATTTTTLSFTPLQKNLTDITVSPAHNTSNQRVLTPIGKLSRESTSSEEETTTKSTIKNVQLTPMRSLLNRWPGLRPSESIFFETETGKGQLMKKTWFKSKNNKPKESSSSEERPHSKSDERGSRRKCCGKVLHLHRQSCSKERPCTKSCSSDSDSSQCSYSSEECSEECSSSTSCTQECSDDYSSSSYECSR